MKNKIIKNAYYLFGLQIFNLLLPLLSYPYLIKVLGSDLYGEFIYTNGIVILISIFISYGYDLTGTKLISENSDNHNKINEIFVNILFVKIIIASIAIPVFMVIGYLSDKTIYYFFFIGIFLDKIFFPTWFFQGLERMGYIAAINSITKITTLLLIFSIVKVKDDIYYLILIYSFSSLLLSWLGMWQANKINKIEIKNICLENIKTYINIGFDYFYSSLFVSIKDRANIIIVGHLFSNHFVLVYDLSIKIITLLSIPIGVANNVTYPRIVKNKSFSFLKKLVTVCFLYSIFSCIISIFIINKIDFNFINLNNSDKEYIFYILSVPVMLAISQTIARNYLNAFGFRKEYLNSVTFVTGYYFFAVLSIYLFLGDLTFKLFIMTILSTYLVEMLLRMYYLHKCHKKSVPLNKYLLNFI